ncbi:5'/3'-nucleotidase SurE [Planctomycetota bacterium]
MRILLTNDDGIRAPGLCALYPLLCEVGEVVVVAPDACRSGTSHSITYIEPLTVQTVAIDELFTGYAVLGSPADCVKLACHTLLDTPIDLVVSGINAGANVGINVHYSGTVAAAIEGAFLGIPAVALSTAYAEEIDFHEAASLAITTLKQLMPVVSGDVLNINVPQLIGRPVQGVRVVPQSTHGFDEYYIAQKSTDQSSTYQLSAGQHRPDPLPTDAMLLTEGYITVTPLCADLTDHARLSVIKTRLSDSRA